MFTICILLFKPFSPIVFIVFLHFFLLGILILNSTISWLRLFSLFRWRWIVPYLLSALPLFFFLHWNLNEYLWLSSRSDALRKITNCFFLRLYPPPCHCPSRHYIKYWWLQSSTYYFNIALIVKCDTHLIRI